MKQVNLKTFTEEGECKKTRTRTNIILGYRLKGAEIRIGNNPTGEGNHLCTTIDKPKGTRKYTFRTYM